MDIFGKKIDAVIFLVAVLIVISMLMNSGLRLIKNTDKLMSSRQIKSSSMDNKSLRLLSLHEVLGWVTKLLQEI